MTQMNPQAQSTKYVFAATVSSSEDEAANKANADGAR